MVYSILALAIMNIVKRTFVITHGSASRKVCAIHWHWMKSESQKRSKCSAEWGKEGVAWVQKWGWGQQRWPSYLQWQYPNAASLGICSSTSEKGDVHSLLPGKAPASKIGLLKSPLAILPVEAPAALCWDFPAQGAQPVIEATTRSHPPFNGRPLPLPNSTHSPPLPPPNVLSSHCCLLDLLTSAIPVWELPSTVSQMCLVACSHIFSWWYTWYGPYGENCSWNSSICTPYFIGVMKYWIYLTNIYLRSWNYIGQSIEYTKILNRKIVLSLAMQL